MPDSLIEKLKSLKIQIPNKIVQQEKWELIDICIAIIRQHQAQDSEFDAGFNEAKRQAVAIGVRHWRASLEPVSVSLEKCAIAASQWLKGANMGAPTWDRLTYTQRSAYVQQAKAVLAVAGVAYAD